MGIAALILGIVSLLIGFIPFCGFFAIIPALVGLILGIVDVIKKNKPDAENNKKGVPIAGIVLSSIAIVFVIIYNLFWGVLIYDASKNAIESDYDYDYDYNYDYNY